MNHMKQVANMLGVEVGEVFRLKEYESYFKFTEKTSNHLSMEPHG